MRVPLPSPRLHSRSRSRSHSHLGRRRLRQLPLLLTFASIPLACGSNDDSKGYAPGNDGGAAAQEAGNIFGSGDGGGGGGNGGCKPNPANYDIPANGCDDDANGVVDDVAPCDKNLPTDGPATDLAKALGLCQIADDTHWGLVSATFTHDYGQATPVNDGQHGILPKFGNIVKPREGSSLGVLSSGFAREYDCAACDTDPFQDGSPMLDNGTVPTGFPKPSQSCEVETDVHDVIDLKLTIKAPANAQGIQFDFDFWSGEWPQWVCTSYNDGFIAYLQSAAFNNGAPDNFSFDVKKNPVSVNNAFFDRCTPNATVGCNGNASTMACAGGASELEGTGFYDLGDYCTGETTGGGATGWLTSQAPAKPGETLTVDFIIWDTHDQAYDSSVLLDNLTWLPGPVTTGTTRPPPK